MLAVISEQVLMVIVFVGHVSNDMFKATSKDHACARLFVCFPISGARQQFRGSSEPKNTRYLQW